MISAHHPGNGPRTRRTRDRTPSRPYPARTAVTPLTSKNHREHCRKHPETPGLSQYKTVQEEISRYSYLSKRCTPGASADTPDKQIRVRQEPARADAGHPLHGAGGHRAVSMIRNIRGMILTIRGMSDRIRAGRPNKFARLQRRPPESHHKPVSRRRAVGLPGREAASNNRHRPAGRASGTTRPRVAPTPLRSLPRAGISHGFLTD